MSYNERVKHPGILNDILFKIVFGTSSGEPTMRALVNAVLERSVYYLSKFYSEQIQRGASYHNLLKTVSISLVDFNLIPETKEIHSTFLLREKTTGLVLSDVLELHYVELKKFKLAKPQELRTRFERWLYFLKFADIYAPEDTVLPDNLAQEEGIAMALESMRRAYAKDPVRELSEAREKAERDELNRLYTAKLEGKLEAAQAMLSLGIDLATVCEKLGLRPEDLKL